jgi:hypothetical protein
MQHRISILLALMVLAACSTVWAQDSPVPPVGLSLAAELEVHKKLLEEDLERFEALKAQRGELAIRLAELYESLDAAVEDDSAASLQQVELLVERVGLAEAEREELLSRQGMLIDGIRERRRAVALLEEELDSLQGRQRRRGGMLDGMWDVILMPAGQEGSFMLSLSGTVISGTYQLDGGWTGSLQGTLVNRKVYMVRIDSKKGRMMELEGFVADDDKRIRGTWLSYELAGGDGATGQWSAEKREDDR